MRFEETATPPRRKTLLVLPALLFLLSIADVLSTGWGLSNGLVEVNPLFSSAMVPLKFLGCGMLCLASRLQNRLDPNARFVSFVVLGVVIAYSLVLVNNIVCILHALRF